MTTPTTTADDLFAVYPEAAAQLIARGRAEGITAERARALQHIRLGAQGVDYRLAHASIESGAELTPELAEQYLQQRLQRYDIDQRQAESDAAGAVLDGYTSRSTPSTGRDAVADEVERLMSRHTGDPHPEPRNLIR